MLEVNPILKFKPEISNPTQKFLSGFFHRAAHGGEVVAQDTPPVLFTFSLPSACVADHQTWAGFPSCTPRCCNRGNLVPGVDFSISSDLDSSPLLPASISSALRGISAHFLQPRLS